jgi:hypothetical protein
VLLRIASVSVCSAVPCDRPKRSSISCVSSGQDYHLQAQGDFCGIARRMRKKEIEESIGKSNGLFHRRRVPPCRPPRATDRELPQLPQPA